MQIAVIGLGAMGSRIARRLLGAGHQVAVWNRTPERAEPVAAAGARAAVSPADAAAGASHVITMVADAPALLDLVRRPDGLAGALGAGQTLLEMSTVGPTAIREVRALIARSVAMADTPVLGSLSEVDAGSLTVFAGGNEATVGAARPLLEPLASRVLHVGPLGTGAAAKLVANATLLSTLAALGESFAVGRRLGLDDEQVLEVLGTTPLAAQADRRRQVLTGDTPDVRFRLALGLKDAALIAAEAHGAGADIPLLDAVEGWFRGAVDAGAGDLDYSAVVQHIAQVPRSADP